MTLKRLEADPDTELPTGFLGAGTGAGGHLGEDRRIEDRKQRMESGEFGKTESMVIVIEWECLSSVRKYSFRIFHRWVSHIQSGVASLVQDYLFWKESFDVC